MPSKKKILNKQLHFIMTKLPDILKVSTTEGEIKKLIENLPNKTSSGYDNINNILLKKLCNSITLPLSYIFNLSISKGIFPTKMKFSETTPLYKGKETYYTNNY